jgi:hypothetical protein
MKIKVHRKSLNYRAWKRWHGTYEEPKSLCPYFWASVFQWTLGLAVASVIAIFAAFIEVFAWFLGQRANWFASFVWGEKLVVGDYNADLYNFKRRDKFYRFAPWQIAWPLVVAFAIVKAILWGMAYPWASEFRQIISNPGCHVVVEVLLTAGVLWAIGAFLTSNFFKTYVKARVIDKVCPRIEVVD